MPPVNGEGLTKSDGYMQIIEALQVAKAIIIKIWSGIKGCNEEVIRACGGLPAGPPPHEG